MHGRVQPKGEGFRSLQRRNSLHMRSVPPLVTKDDSEAPVVGNPCSSLGSVRISAAGDSFFKDGRKISVGDCALFKPPQDSPPFIGLIRWLKVGKENNLQLGVSWLYRTAELNLAKGVSVEGAPNEVFYSFHKDEIPAASLLHPCKVAFLPRGVELPTGASSFVCRRVYDIASKSLWWLTDKDYIDERQEEVDKLLHKTKTEMHAMLQPGGRSPKQVNGPTSTSQSKPVADSGQNSGTSLHSQGKGKKRERGDHGSEPIKRERSLKADDADSLQCKIESNLNSEIAQITEKGGIVDLEGVDKLIRLMQPEGTERKMDMSSRSMLAGVMAATDKADCLNHFIQLRGLAVLDEWLQDIHKGRIGDASNMKDSDKSVEEFLLVLLRALDKLPVNLQALQMCNIGRSVNHLRSHKNLEIQRKARGLVDTWKKRVEAEMISNDAKSGSTQGVSWPSKSRLPDSSQAGVRTPTGSDVATKNTCTPNSAAKTISTRSSHGEGNVKSATSSPGTLKQASPTSLGQESHPRNSAGVTIDIPQIKEERVNRSNQSQNYNQFLSAKEDGKNAMAGSVTPNKMSSSGTRSKKVSGFPAISGNSNQKEMSSGRVSSSQKVAALEKRPHAGLSGYRVLEGAVTEGNNHKLIVKIPNRVRSPAQGSGVGSVEDSTYMSSQISSPALSDKHEQLDRASMDKIEVNHCNASSDANVESQQDNDSRDVSSGSADGVGSRAFPDEGQSMATEDSRMLVDSLPLSQHKFADLRSSSFSPMNALIESCAKYSEINTSPSLEDDGGMDLLASVATREMSRSDLVSPTASTEMNTPAAEEICVGDEAKSMSLEDHTVGDKRQTYNDSDSDTRKQEAVHNGLRSEDGLHSSKPVQFSADRISDVYRASEDIPADRSRHSEISTKDMRNNAYPKLGISEEVNKPVGTASLPLPYADKVRESEPDEKIVQQTAVCSNACPDGNSKSENFRSVVEEIEGKTNADQCTVEAVKPKVEVAALIQSCEVDHEKDANEVLKKEISLMERPVSSVNISELREGTNGEKRHNAANDQKPLYEAVDDVNGEESDGKDGKNRMTKSGLKSDVAKSTGVFDKNLDTAASDMENKENVQHALVVERPHLGQVDHEGDQKPDLSLPNSARLRSDEAKDCAAIAAEVSSHTAGTSDGDGKLKFDLNEGFSADDGKFVDHPVNLMSTPVQMFNSLKYSLNSIPHGHSSSITVASAAKGPFVPPDDLLRNKGELGWKGSAATSAFRPAEPRRAHETTVGPPSMPGSDASTSKPVRVPLDFDLNVPDEGLVKEMSSRDSSLAVDSTANFLHDHAMPMNKPSSSMPVSSRSAGHLDLDLNSADEANDNGTCSNSTNCAGEDSMGHGKQLVGGLPSGDVRRDFDLNDGPGVDDANAEMFSINQQVNGGVPPQLPPAAAGLRLNGPGLGSFSSWFPTGNVYSTMAIPSMLPDRGEHHFPVYQPNTSQRQFAPSAASPFTPEAFRGSVLSSSPAVNFPSGPFQFPVFPFGTSFPVPSATSSVGAASYGEPSTGPRLFAPPLHPQLLGPVGAVPSQFPRPYVVSLPESSSNGFLDNNRKWSRQGLDLNAGPGATETESNREEIFPMASGQLSVGSSRALTEEQARMYSASGGIMKRKEPEGGWENESFRYKQSSWR